MYTFFLVFKVSIHNIQRQGVSVLGSCSNRILLAYRWEYWMDHAFIRLKCSKCDTLALLIIALCMCLACDTPCRFNTCEIRKHFIDRFRRIEENGLTWNSHWITTLLMWTKGLYGERQHCLLVSNVVLLLQFLPCVWVKLLLIFLPVCARAFWASATVYVFHEYYMRHDRLFVHTMIEYVCIMLYKLYIFAPTHK